MRIVISAVGRLKVGPERELTERYVERADKAGRSIGITEVACREILESRARETAQRAGLSADGIDAVYFTGGSTGLKALTERLAAAFPQAQALHGDRLASVASGLGLDARRRFAS